MHNYPSTSNHPSTSYQSNTWSKPQPWSTQVPMRYNNPRCLACAAERYPGRECVTQSHQNIFRDRESLNTENASIQVNTPGTPDHERLGFIDPNHLSNNLAEVNHASEDALDHEMLGFINPNNLPSNMEGASHFSEATLDHEMLGFVDHNAQVNNHDMVNDLDVSGLSIENAKDSQSISDHNTIVGTIDHERFGSQEPNDQTTNQTVSPQCISKNLPNQTPENIPTGKTDKDTPHSQENANIKDDRGYSNEMITENDNLAQEDQTKTKMQSGKETENSVPNTQHAPDPMTQDTTATGFKENPG